ncbi:MAG: VWA domain-containing protein [Acidobacteriia bacterium]|nr:VWA domain-containing protein [Terriglobia bacterium]
MGTGTRLKFSIGLACAAAVQSPPLPAQQMRVQDHVEVHRVLVDARVVDRRGDPVTSLSPNDFRVFIDRRPTTVKSLEWVEGTEPFAEGLTPEQAAESGAQTAPPGRLVVFFFQSDFAPARLTGLMHMKARAIRFLATLQPSDRVAVLSFDSHLELRQDFTADRERLTAAIHRSIRFGGEDNVPPSPFPSLVPFFDRDAAKRAASPETGLLVVARALEKLPGSKSLVFFGWGLGHLSGDSTMRTVTMGRDYAPARAALVRGRVSVFAIDVTDADFHDLEVGLRQVAEDTGGFYAKTNLFPGQAMTRVEGALAGYYVLEVEALRGPHGYHTISVEVVGTNWTVLAKPGYED